MALYLGSSKKQRIMLNGVAYYANLFAQVIITNGGTLLSSDNYVLKDSNGFYITAKEDE